MSCVWSTQDILLATGGRLLQGSGGVRTGRIWTDSRTLQENDVFLALAGERFDGHDYILQAASAGIKTFIVAERAYRDRTQSARITLASDLDVIAVPDTLEAYGMLARFHRRRLDIPVVAVTGSVGKSSTRRMIASVLASEFPIRETEKNENNLIGVPKTILSTSETERAIVVELGIDRPGEMAQLLRASEPSVGVMVGITYVHLDRLHSLDGVAREKGLLLEAVRTSGWAVLNIDTPLASYFASRCGKVLTYGLERSACVSGIVTGYDERGCVEGEIIVRGYSHPLRLRAPGEHQLKNALAAWAVGELFEIAPQKRRKALESYEGFPGRFQMKALPSGARIVDDTYNANPASFLAALNTLQDLPASRRIVVAGDMFELGDLSTQLHLELGTAIAKRNIQRLITVGPRSRYTAEGAVTAGMPGEAVTSCTHTEQAVDLLANDLHAGDLVLVKGSRGMTMEKVVEGLIARCAKEVQH